MTEKEMQDKILELNDKLKKQEETIQDLTQTKTILEETKGKLEVDNEELRKTTNHYFQRIIMQDKQMQVEETEEEKETIAIPKINDIIKKLK